MPKKGTRLEPPNTKLPDHWERPKLDAILADVADGVFPVTAARAQGIPEYTWYEWVRWGRLGYEPFASFQDEVLTAKAKANAWHVKNLKRHANGEMVDERGRPVGDWRASAWYLPRACREQFSDKGLQNTGHASPSGAGNEETKSVDVEWLSKALGKLGLEVTEKEDERANDANQATSDASGDT